MDTIPATSSKSLTKDTNFSKLPLNCGCLFQYYKTYITTEEVMDMLDMFHARFGKVYEFG